MSHVRDRSPGHQQRRWRTTWLTRATFARPEPTSPVSNWDSLSQEPDKDIEKRFTLPRFRAFTHPIWIEKPHQESTVYMMLVASFLMSIPEYKQFGPSLSHPYTRLSCTSKALCLQLFFEQRSLPHPNTSCMEPPYWPLKPPQCMQTPGKVERLGK